MKTLKQISIVPMVALAFSLVLSSCKNNQEVKPQGDILPATLRVAIPASMSNQNVTAVGGRIAARSKEDTLKGNEIYQNLNTFIAVGDVASKAVEEFMGGIRKYHIDRIISLTYVSSDDNRTKNLVVESEVTFEGKSWDYELTVTDADGQGDPDGGKGLQIFWNKRNLVQGIAIIKPYNCDRVKNANMPDALFRIDYTEGGALGYDAQMEVRIAGIPLGNPLDNPFAIGSLHMFVGKAGDVVDVFGNSNHPNAILFSSDTGFDWAFVASGSDPKNIAVAEVGLPPSKLDASDRTILLKDYSIKNVFTQQINATWPGLDPALVASYLKNTAAPGYFNTKNGFLSGGVSPGADWDVLASRLDAMSPYNPLQTSNLTISFK